MKQNEILTEIRRGREEHARECNYDVRVMFEQMRAETERLRAEGWNVIPPASATQQNIVLREEPPEP